MSDIERIKRASRRLRSFCAALMCFIPLAVGLSWLFWDNIPLSQLNLPVAPNPNHPAVVFVLGFLISMIPAGVMLYAVGVLRRLFGLYARGVIFDRRNVACYRALGWSALAWVAADFLSQPLHGLALTWFNPPGQRLLILGLNSNMLMAVFTGAAVLTIAWVMDEARKTEEDQALII